MERPPRGASYATSIKCSHCDADVAMQEIVDHVCRQGKNCLSSMSEEIAESRIAYTTTMVEEPEQMLVLASSTTNYTPTASIRPFRPFVPQIDPFATNRTIVNGELTPASSHGSIGQSPVSPGAGRRSPFLHPPRKTSAPVIRRPPSPELLSQDCAFPPFPTNRVKSKNNSNDNHHHSKSNLRGRSHTPEAGHSSSSFEREAKRSASVGATRSRFRKGTNDSSRPSTANSSRQPSLSSRGGSRQGSIDQVPPLPSLQPSLSHTTTASDSEPRAIEQQNFWPSPPDFVRVATAPQAESSISPFPELAVQDNDQSHSGSRTTSPNQSDSPSIQELSKMQLVPEPITENGRREPSYKAKRPAPIGNLPLVSEGVVPIPKPEPSPRELPPHTPSSTLARTFTNLFGRKRNHSTSSKKGNAKTSATDRPRFIALSPDPDPQEQVQPEITLSSSTDSGIMSVSPVYGPEENVQLPADTASPESKVPEPMPAQIVEPTPLEEQQRDSLQLEQDFENILAAVVPVPRLSTVPEHTEEMKRVSIDSASSYGSEGFSHSRTSSFSMGALNAHSYGSSISTARTTTSSEDFLGPAFAKLKGLDTVPDSPTDPHMQHGRLATVPERSSETPAEYKENLSPVPITVAPAPENEAGYFDLPKLQKPRRPSTPGAIRGVCRGCSQAIVSGQKSVSSKDGRLTGRYHKECFVCKTCREPFATADFYVHHDFPYCAHDYHVVNETLCESCGKGIEGHYLETSNMMGKGTKKFHPQCLRCATCKLQLNDDYFELGGRVYCERDAFRMINVSGPRSPYGTAPSRPSPLNREYISSGEPGQALAGGKFPERRLTRLMTTY